METSHHAEPMQRVTPFMHYPKVEVMLGTHLIVDLDYAEVEILCTRP